MSDLGWWTISGEALLDFLRRAHDGEDPDMLYAVEYANSGHEHVEPDRLRWCFEHDSQHQVAGQCYVAHAVGDENCDIAKATRPRRIE